MFPLNVITARRHYRYRGITAFPVAVAFSNTRQQAASVYSWHDRFQDYRILPFLQLLAKKLDIYTAEECLNAERRLFIDPRRLTTYCYYYCFALGSKFPEANNMKLKSKVGMARGPVLYRQKQSSRALRPN